MNGTSGAQAPWIIALSLTVLMSPEVAWGGVPECNNLRLEDMLGCEVRTETACEEGCTMRDVYHRTCATELRTVCKQECTLDAEPSCTDECTEGCAVACDQGVNVICQHNCFGECSSSCESDCESSDDPAQCVATCEANCDGECDARCRPLVGASCYQHCVECCGGSCTAQANMTCQQSCQEGEFQSCEWEVNQECQANCRTTGSLFCDGEFVMTGDAMPVCVEELIRREIGNLQISAEVSGGIGISPDGVLHVEGEVQVEAEGLPAFQAGDESDDYHGSGCSIVVGRPEAQTWAWLLGLLLLGLGSRRGAPTRLRAKR